MDPPLEAEDGNPRAGAVLLPALHAAFSADCGAPNPSARQMA